MKPSISSIIKQTNRDLIIKEIEKGKFATGIWLSPYHVIQESCDTISQHTGGVHFVDTLMLPLS